MWLIIQVQFTPKMILNFCVRSDQALTMMKTGQDNDMTKHTSAIYAENVTELLCPIKLSAICDKNKTGQQYDRSYRSGLCRDQN